MVIDRSRVTLVKSILEAIQIFRHSSIYTQEVLEKIGKKLFRFLHTGKIETEGNPLIKWKVIAKPTRKVVGS